MKALILIDLINDMVSADGRLSGKGYYNFAMRHETAAALTAWRTREDVGVTVHVGLEFRVGYPDLPTRSILLGKAAEFGVARFGDAGSEFVSWAQPEGHDIVVRKRRISPFYGTDLEVVLRSMKVDHLTIGGVATDLAVSSAARDAHDRDFIVTVAAGICVAATDADHMKALDHIAKFSTVQSS